MATSKQRLDEVLQTPNIEVHMFRDNGTFTNNEKLPLVLYQGAIKLLERAPASTVEEIFYAYGWDDSWRNGIYPYHHYHSNAHKLLGVSRGSATVQLGVLQFSGTKWTNR